MNQDKNRKSYYKVKLIDVHSHLSAEEFDLDREDIIKSAQAASIMKLIISTLNYSEINKAWKIINEHKDFIYLTIGCEPSLVVKKDEIKRIQDFIFQNKEIIIGIGEVGLDYYKDISAEEKSLQIGLFREWIAIAKQLNLPIIVHSRSAGKYALDILFEEKAEKVLMHAFDGKAGFAQKAAGVGFYFSIPPSVIRSQQKQRLVKALDVKRIMLESDAPVLGPIPFERNQPAYITYGLEKIAQLKNTSIENIAEIVYQNTLSFFYQIDAKAEYL